MGYKQIIRDENPNYGMKFKKVGFQLIFFVLLPHFYQQRNEQKDTCILN